MCTRLTRWPQAASGILQSNKHKRKVRRSGAALLHTVAHIHRSRLCLHQSLIVGEFYLVSLESLSAQGVFKPVVFPLHSFPSEPTLTIDSLSLIHSFPALPSTDFLHRYLLHLLHKLIKSNTEQLTLSRFPSSLDSKHGHTMSVT